MTASRKPSRAGVAPAASAKRTPSLEGMLRRLAHGVDLWTVWRDFCELSAIAISNTVDLAQRDEREARYLSIAKRYSREQLDTFAGALGTLVIQLEAGFDDVLGRTFMALELGNKWAGQFFTPFEVCRLTAEMHVDDAMRATIADRGYVTAADPAVGAGAFPIGLAAAMHDAGIPYQQVLHVTAQDIDAKAVHMAYVQLSLFHIPAVVIVGDSLRAPGIGERWYTPAHILGGWSARLSSARVPHPADQAQRPAVALEPPPSANPIDRRPDVQLDLLSFLGAA